ncbi:MAG: methyltransferase [Candidatus Lokiarchaeota archaeon]
MKLKGIDKFREKLPDYKGIKFAIIPITVIISICISYLILILFYNLPILLNSSIPNSIGFLFPIFGVMLVEIIALILVYQMWYWKDYLKNKYGPKSYQKIFFVGFFGIVMMICLGFNNLVIIRSLNPSFWLNYPFSIFAQSLSSIFNIDSPIFEEIRITVGVIIVIIGFLTMVRSLFTFGIDYMTVVYLYFPEESKVETHKIYSVLRHPAYAGLIYICTGGTIIQFSIYAIIFLSLYILGFLVHILLVEEKELIKRFGQSYTEYQKDVPAIIAHIKKWPQFFKFLLSGEKENA